MLSLCDWGIERKFGFPSHPIIGVDEVGRGCLAGPVYAAAFMLLPSMLLEPQEWWYGVRDSKAMTALQREVCAELLGCWPHGIGFATSQEIDTLGILKASLLAMRRAVHQLMDQKEKVTQNVPVILVDGRDLFEYAPCKCHAIIKGDRLSFAIAAASILAKVSRDCFMVELHKKYGAYGFHQHKGYGTAKHLTALQTSGITPEHRLSFKPVALRAALKEY